MLIPIICLRGHLILDSSGKMGEIPVLLTTDGVFEPLLEYSIERLRAKSLSWLKQLTYAVLLLLRFSQEAPSSYGRIEQLRLFALRLRSGTYNPETGIDPTYLCWRPRSPKRVSQIISLLDDFLVWRASTGDGEIEMAHIRRGGKYEKTIASLAAEYRRSKALLGYTWSPISLSPPGSFFPLPQAGPRIGQDPPGFPENRLMEFLTLGFRLGKRYALRDVLITLLLNGAGFRASEAFHLFIDDVMPDPSDPLMPIVTIHHPSLGAAPRDSTGRQARSSSVSRAEYLSSEYGLVPRNQILGSKGAGWKGGFYDGQAYKRAYWFPRELGELFLRCWYVYLAEIALLARAHPFAFVSLRGSSAGDMYTLKQYSKAHKRACERVGLVSSKQLGTTPHGHRHAYALRLRRAGVGSEHIRRFLHHASIESQVVYVQPSLSEMIDVLSKAQVKLGSLSGHSMVGSSSPSAIIATNSAALGGESNAHV